MQRIILDLRAYFSGSAVLFMLLCFAAQIKANDGYVDVSHGGITLRDGKNSAIRMDSEYVEIRLYKDYYTVDATFWLFNTGKKKTIQVGFPHTFNYRSSINFDPTDFIEIIKDKGVPTPYINLKTSVNDSLVLFRINHECTWKLDINGGDNRPLTTIKKVNQWWKNTGKHLPEDGRYVILEKDWLFWIVKDVVFPQKQTTKTFVNFQFEYAYRDEDRLGKYIFGSGISWRSNIIKSVFLIKKDAEVSDAALIVVIDREYEQKGIVKRTKTDNEELLEFTNFKPTASDAIEFELQAEIDEEAW